VQQKDWDKGLASAAFFIKHRATFARLFPSDRHRNTLYRGNTFTMSLAAGNGAFPLLEMEHVLIVGVLKRWSEGFCILSASAEKCKPPLRHPAGKSTSFVIRKRTRFK
jgi:hypothetical protein